MGVGNAYLSMDNLPKGPHFWKKLIFPPLADISCGSSFAGGGVLQAPSSSVHSWAHNSHDCPNKSATRLNPSTLPCSFEDEASCWMNPELINRARLASQSAPSILLSQPLLVLGLQGCTSCSGVTSVSGFWGSNWAPHVCLASTLPTKSSPSLLIFSFFFGTFSFAREVLRAFGRTRRAVLLSEEVLCSFNIFCPPVPS